MRCVVVEHCGEDRERSGGDAIRAVSATGRGRMSLPLEGVLIADFSRVLSGPMSTMLLADLGATVVKVERPGTGDETRAWGPPYASGHSTYYLATNRNKRSVALDLAEPEDLAAARKLALRADVLIENFRPGAMDRLGLGYEDLRAENPGLVYCSISGFGRQGGASLPGFDFVAQAMGGLMSITGEPDGEPMKIGVALVDVIAGLFATIGVLAALRARGAGGRGQHVDVDLLSSVLCAMVNQSSAFVAAGVVPGRLGNAHPSIAPYETVRARDQPFVIAVGNDRQFAALCDVLALDGVARDPRFATNSARTKHRRELHELIEAALATRDASEWLGALAAYGVPCGRVNDIREAFELAESLGLQPLQTLVMADGSEVGQVSNPIRLSGTPATYDSAPPSLGEHTDEVRAWLADDDAGPLPRTSGLSARADSRPGRA